MLSHTGKPPLIVDTGDEDLVRLGGPFCCRHLIARDVNSGVAHGIGYLLLTLVEIGIKCSGVVRIVNRQKSAKVTTVVFPVGKNHVIGVIGSSKSFKRPAVLGISFHSRLHVIFHQEVQVGRIACTVCQRVIGVLHRENHLIIDFIPKGMDIAIVIQQTEFVVVNDALQQRFGLGIIIIRSSFGGSFCDVN